MEHLYDPFALQLPLKIGYLHAIFSTDHAPKVMGTQCVSVPHNHHDYELRYVAQGNCALTVAGETIHARAKDILLVRPSEYHFQGSAQEDAVQYTVRFALGNNTAPKAYRAVTDFLNRHRILRDENEDILPLFKMMAYELYHRRAGFISNLRALCTMLLTHLLRCGNADFSKLYPAEEMKYHDFERHALERYFDTYALTSAATVGDLAKSMNITERQINNIFHKIYGMPFTKKINEIRLEHAAKLLATTDASIEKILGQSGYRNYNYFSQCFKQRFGMTPMRYRAQHKK